MTLFLPVLNCCLVKAPPKLLNQAAHYDRCNPLDSDLQSALIWYLTRLPFFWLHICHYTLIAFFWGWYYDNVRTQSSQSVFLDVNVIGSARRVKLTTIVQLLTDLPINIRALYFVCTWSRGIYYLSPWAPIFILHNFSRYIRGSVNKTRCLQGLQGLQHNNIYPGLKFANFLGSPLSINLVSLMLSWSF